MHESKLARNDPVRMGIVSALGVGGMGEVYRARDTKLERDVAIIGAAGSWRGTW